MSGPRYPNVEVQLTGRDSNAFVILGSVSSALRGAGIDKAERDAFMREATAGDYDQLLATCMRWVSVS